VTGFNASSAGPQLSFSAICPAAAGYRAGGADSSSPCGSQQRPSRSGSN